jgi:hypothetical protein
MEIITVKDTRELPNEPVYAYMVRPGETHDRAVEMYSQRFNTMPERAWMWANYLYFELPIVKGN